MFSNLKQKTGIIIFNAQKIYYPEKIIAHEIVKIIPLNQLNPFLLDMVFKNNTDLSVSHVPILS